MNIQKADDVRVYIKSRSGSTLIWALIMMMVLGILITGGLAVAASYSNRSVDAHVQKQSYYTALSVTKSVAEWLSGASEDDTEHKGTQLEFINDLREGTEHSQTIDTGISASLGDCSTTVSYDMDTGNITISSTANYNGEESTVNCTMSYGESATGTGQSSAGKIKLASIPNGQPSEATDPSEEAGETLTAANGDFNIRRVIQLDYDKADSYKLTNALSKQSKSGWKAQYYALDVSGGEGENTYLKLSGEGFPDTDDSGVEQNRAMTVYPTGSALNGNYNSFIMYTEEKDAPKSHLFLTTNMTETVKVNSNPLKSQFGFKAHVDTEMKNVRIQISDTGETDDPEKKSLFAVTRGINMTGNSSIYTRRDTYLGAGYKYSGGMYSNYKPKTGEDEFTNGVSSFTPSTTKIGRSFTLEGDLIVADNTTRFGNPGIFKEEDGTETRLYDGVDGNIILTSTSTDEGVLIVSNGVHLRGGNIYVKNGGHLKLSGWYSVVECDIFIEPGGKVTFTGGNQIFGNIYALGGIGENGQRATIDLSSQNCRTYNKMETLDGIEVNGGIYLGGETKDGKGDGAVIIKGTGGYITAPGCLHQEYGSEILGTGIIGGDQYCDARVRKVATAKVDKICKCHIAVPEYGNVVDSWQVLGYSEK